MKEDVDVDSAWLDRVISNVRQINAEDSRWLINLILLGKVETHLLKKTVLLITHLLYKKTYGEATSEAYEVLVNIYASSKSSIHPDLLVHPDRMAEFLNVVSERHYSVNLFNLVEFWAKNSESSRLLEVAVSKNAAYMKNKDELIELFGMFIKERMLGKDRANFRDLDLFCTYRTHPEFYLALYNYCCLHHMNTCIFCDGREIDVVELLYTYVSKCADNLASRIIINYLPKGAMVVSHGNVEFYQYFLDVLNKDRHSGGGS